MTRDAVYGLGRSKYTYQGHLLVFHSGSVTALGAYALYVPDLDWAVTIMANTQGSSSYANSALAYYLIDEMLAVPNTKRYDWLKAELRSHLRPWNCLIIPGFMARTDLRYLTLQIYDPGFCSWTRNLCFWRKHIADVDFSL